MVRVWYPYEHAIPFCGDVRRWPDVAYECERRFAHCSPRKIIEFIGGLPMERDRDLLDTLTLVWHNSDDSWSGDQQSNPYDDANAPCEHEQLIANTLDAIVDEIDRRLGRRPTYRPPPNGGAQVSYGD